MGNKSSRDGESSGDDSDRENHCYTRLLALLVLKKHFPQIPSSVFDPRGHRCFCGECFTREDIVFWRGDPKKKYCLPVGWTRFGLSTDESFLEMNNVWDDWHVSFHGTSAKNMALIFQAGKRLLKAGDVALGGKKLGIPDGHIKGCFKRVNLYTGKAEIFDPHQIYTSPSARYAGNAAYAAYNRFPNPVRPGENLLVQFMFQIRQRPGSYAIGQETVGAAQDGTILDPHFSNNELEWYTQENVGICVHGLCVRVYEEETPDSKYDTEEEETEEEETEEEETDVETYTERRLRERRDAKATRRHKARLEGAPVLIAGATGPNAVHVNGMYEPTDQVHNKRTLFRKRGDPDKWLRYTLNKTWMISNTKNTEANNKIGWCHSVEKGLRDPCEVSTWNVWAYSEWGHQDSVQAIHCVCQPVHIAGATGPNAVFVNGMYEPTHQVYNKRTLFRKRGDPDKWLRYTLNKTWMVSNRKNTEMNNKIGWCHSVEKGLRDPCEVSAWNVWASSKWGLQDSVQAIHCVCQPVRIAGATGPNAVYVNGMYEPTDQVYNKRTLFRKQGDPNKWLRYISNKTWMVSNTKNKDANTTKGWCHSVEKRLLDPCEVSAWNVWANGRWQLQGSVRVNPLLKSSYGY